jgi:ankyrin repeat protein
LGKTALHVAAEKGCIPVMSVLLAKRADIEAKDKVITHVTHNLHVQSIKVYTEI